ncbi:hypothetical protein Tco_1374111 [Tanacetum coccineum]
MSSDSAHSTVSYTSISSYSDLPPWGFHLISDAEPQSPEAAPQSLEQAPPSPDYVPSPEYSEYLASSDDEILDLEEDPEEDLADYPADKGDDEEEQEEESFEDDDEEEEEASEDDEEDEEHLAPADPTPPRSP